MDMNMKGWLHVLSFVLVVVGALNWGLVGLFNINLVTWLLGMGGLSQLVYVLVGLGAVYLLFTHSGECKTCVMMMGGKKKKR